MQKPLAEHKYQLGMSREDIARIEDALFFDPPETRDRVIRFVALIIFSSIIASGGLLSGSVAAIIGAMIIAPLMIPIMGIVVASVMGNPQRAWRSAIVLVSGIGMAILVGWIMGKFMPGGWDPTTSSEILARTNPKTLDLVVALASGGAGAYALSRQDVGDSLPGVAIAISLVPPLNTAGLLLAGGDNALARGALLLFITNMAAIFLAGTVMFFFTGLVAGAHRTLRDLVVPLVAILIFVVAVATPLLANSDVYWTDVNNEDASKQAVQSWLEGTDWELYEVDVDGNDIEVVLGGDGPVPPTEKIIAELTEINGSEMNLTARILGVRKEVITGSP